MTPEATRALIGRLRRLQDATKNGRVAMLPEGAVSRLDLIERRLIAAVSRGTTPGPTRDGFPGGHPGMGGEDAPQSTTEGAAMSRLKGRPKDEALDNAVLAYRHLETAVNALAELTMRLDLIDDRTKPEAKYGNIGGSCCACDRHVEGTAVDRLRRGMCSSCYRAWLREGRPDVMEFRRTRSQEAA